ncbi:alpha/beta hydrolase [Bradyrhizobium sp. SSUT18]|uniref:alpha/beta fold hydrolase n=1 Tax=unclassified Bradyrhizobium TaxID=2631580 RepID=UPI002449E992|nr:alpha/beta hydrolase [Bradyrhizobium sp. SSUT18]MDH2399228.1 alpha/beta hydrolase [Bradyrhizobium sp. SSUT18]
MRSRRRTVAGLRLGVLESASGRVGTLLIHGNSSSKEIFARQFRALESMGLGVVAPDLPGHGESDRSNTPRKTYSFPGYAALLHQLMTRLGYRSYHVVGWSLGGHIGIEMLAHYREVRSLVLTGTPPVRLNAEGVGAGFRWTPSTALAGRRRFSSDDCQRYVRAMMGARRASDAHLRAAAAADGNARYWMVRNGMAGVGADEVETVCADERPLAILQGAADPFVRIEYINGLKYRNIWKGSPVLLDAGHAPHWQAPATFNRYMREFLHHAG